MEFFPVTVVFLVVVAVFISLENWANSHRPGSGCLVMPRASCVSHCPQGAEPFNTGHTVSDLSKTF